MDSLAYIQADVYFGARHVAEKRRIEQPHLVADCGRGLFLWSIKPLGDRFYRTFARRSVAHLFSLCGCLSSQVSALRYPLPVEDTPPSVHTCWRRYFTRVSSIRVWVLCKRNEFAGWVNFCGGLGVFSGPLHRWYIRCEYTYTNTRVFQRFWFAIYVEHGVTMYREHSARSNFELLSDSARVFK